MDANFNKALRYPGITSYILMGGKSRRMGQDKRFLQIEGMTLLEKTIFLVENTIGRRPILVGDNIPVEWRLRYYSLPDYCPGKGPLGGLVSALKHCPTKWAMMLPVDMPWQTEKELLRLFEFSALDYDVLAFINDGFLQPLSALYRRERAGFWEKRLQAEELSLYRGILELRWQAIEISTSKSWVNLNYLEDLLLHQVSISNPS